MYLYVCILKYRAQIFLRFVENYIFMVIPLIEVPPFVIYYYYSYELRIML